MLKEYIRLAVEGETLSEDSAADAMRVIMSGQATDAQIAAFLVAMRLMGVAVSEITGFARVMREMATRVDAPAEVVDTCGTGGDRSSSFNISTAAALVAAGMGVKVAKHGNRAVSSSSGSADVLKELGVNIDAETDVVSRCIREAGIGFLFAPRLHKAMKFAIGPRREMGIRTVFNILGPLTNPAGATRQLMGVYDAALTETMAQVLLNLGARRAMVVHGEDGLDEITVTGATKVTELAGGRTRTYKITPEDLGLGRHALSEMTIASPAEGAAALREVLSGAQGARRDVVLANAAAVAVVAGIAEDLAEGVAAAAQSIDTGRAQAALERLVTVSNSPL
jgi:anthranilate phosphoribosyltransferase